MSKYVKNLITGEIRNRLDGVEDAVVANVVGMNSDASFRIRKALREKGINMLVVKRSLAGRAVTESRLKPIFDNQQGSVAVLWGCEDFVSLCKQITTMDKSQEFKGFELKGGVMDGEALTADKVRDVSKWPNREEQISILVGQILNPGATLSGQMLGAGAMLASQIKKLVENKEEDA
jgi:large subunit ribosomal protein L10